jgi:hypothetical protein
MTPDMLNALAERKCPQCHHATPNHGPCTECLSDRKKDPDIRFGDKAGELKLILSHKERQRRAHIGAAESSRVNNSAAVAGNYRAREYEQNRLELAGYVPLEQRIVTARDAITALVREGGTRAHILRAVNEGVLAASESAEAVFTGTEGRKSMVGHTSPGG